MNSKVPKNPRPPHRLPTALLALALVALPAVAAEQAPPAREPVQVYVAWESKPKGATQLAVRLTGGKLIRWRPVAADPVTIRVKKASNTWVFQCDRPITTGGIDLRVACQANDAIEVEIDGKSLRTTLMELAEGPASIRWNAGSLTLSRPASDVVRVRPASGRLLLKPGETTQLLFQIYLLASSSDPIPTTFQLGLARYGQDPASYPVNARYRIVPNRPDRSRFNLEMNAPVEQGLYELVVRVQPENLPAIVRRIPLAVFDATPVRRTGEQTDWDSWLAAAHPVRSARYDAGRWRDQSAWWLSVRRLRELWRGIRPARAEQPADKWAISLPDPTKPHVLRLHAEGKPGNSGLITEIHRGFEPHLPLAQPLKACIWLDESTGSTRSGTSSAELLVLPVNDELSLQVRTPSAELVRTAEWMLGRVPPLERLPMREPRLADPATNRLLILHLSSYAQLYHFAQQSGGLPRHWPLLMAAATNLASYASAGQYDGVAVPVVGQGVVTWPSRLARSGFVWDPDRLPGPRSDPVDKDVPELLFRSCRQRSLLFVPLFRFDGIAFGDSATRPLNPLSATDRAQMVALVEEFVGRYKDHDNLRAIGLIVSPRARTCLSGPADGLDEQIVARFVKDTKLKPPANRTGKALVRWALEHETERLMAWRARQVLAFYKAVLAVLRKQRPKAVCYLIVDFADLQWADQLRRASHRGDDVASVLRESGLDLAGWSLPEGLVLIRPYFESEHSATTLWSNRNRELDADFARHPHGSMCAAEQLPLTSDGSHRRITILRTGQGGSPGATRALANLEPVVLFSAPAVPVLPLRYEQRTLARVLRQLPPGSAQRKTTKGPVRIKGWQSGHVVHWLIANIAAHPVQCTLEFTKPGQVRVAVLRDGGQYEADEGGQRIRLRLNGYDIALLRSPDSTELASMDVTLPQSAENVLRQRFRQITRAVAFLRNADRAPSANLILDGSFEQPDGMSTRWELFPPDQGAYVAEAAHDGQLGLELVGQGARGAYALSWPFTVPPGTKLSVSLFARRLDPKAELFVWLVPTDHPQEHAAAFKVPLTQQWQQHRVQLAPGTGYEEIWSWRLVLHARAGTVLVDEVEATTQALTAEERNAMIKSLAPALRAWYDKRLADFSALTAEYWPQYLLRQFGGGDRDEPTNEQPRPQKPNPQSPPSTQEQQPETADSSESF